jgi:fructose/tagatose bisphosphate aldolase
LKVVKMGLWVREIWKVGESVVEVEAINLILLLLGILTSPEDVEDFIRAGVDYLAPSVGNLHGDYGPKGPNLDMDR